MIHPYPRDEQNAHLDCAQALAAGVLSDTAATVDESGQFPRACPSTAMAPTADHLRDFIGRALTGLPLF